MNQRSRTSQSGNVLWFILVAVVLLGALTLTLSRSSSSVDQSGNFEQLRIKATQLMRYASSIERGIEKLQVINGCSENEISFENSTDTDYTNANSPTDNSCHIFEPEGAGLEWKEFGDDDFAIANNNMAFIENLMITGVGSDTAPAGTDVVMGSIISQNLCNHINSQLGISTTAADISVIFDEWESAYVGSFSSTPVEIPTDGGTALEGQPTGCLIDDYLNYVFYHVIIAR